VQVKKQMGLALKAYLAEPPKQERTTPYVPKAIMQLVSFDMGGTMANGQFTNSTDDPFHMVEPLMGN
jgi:hypothetical protein